MRFDPLDTLDCRALSVPLREPFVIASSRVEETHSVLVTIRAGGHVGLGEAACLPGVTHETPKDVMDRLASVRDGLLGRVQDLGPMLDEALGGAPVARAALECAVLDAASRARGTSVRALIADPGTRVADDLETDITIPILDRDLMVKLAVGWEERGFSIFKAKVGLDFDHDVGALVAIERATHGARFRLDANGGFTADEALHLLAELARHDLAIECFEQPCAAGDLEGMAKVTRDAGIPVVADESVKTLQDLDELLARTACTGVNLKLAKSGGLVACLAIGQRARRAGLRIMVGGMVETRLGMTCAAHLASALGGVDYCDLDTAFLLTEDPFEGGYTSDGPRLRLSGNGLGVSPRA